MLNFIMIMGKVVFSTLFFMFIPLSISKICQIRTSRNETKYVCCADYEIRENDCIACLKGYISDMGENCKPCPKNRYGERCRYDCSCLHSEVCDNVEGCVQFSSTTGSSVYATSDTFMKRLRKKSCDERTESDKIEKICCADYEEKGNGCIACSEGYTSDMGQNCRPCSKYSYGERCRYTCNCFDYEICDHIKGCVESSSADTPSYDSTMAWTTETATVSINVYTTLPWYQNAQTNGENTDTSNGDLSSKEMITYFALPLIVVVLGICVCFIFYKYKAVGKMKKIATIHRQNPSLPHNRPDIEVEERLYDTIGDTNMLRYVQQMLKATTSFNGESQTVENGQNTSSYDKDLQKTTQQF